MDNLIHALETLWIRFGTHTFPATIHPMIVHFPIVLLYLTLLIDLLAYGAKITRSPDRFFDRASFWTLTLSLFAIVAAAAAGILSEQFVKFTPATAAMLSAHQRDATLTGVFALAAWIVRWLAKFPAPARGPRDWSLFGTGRGRITWLSTALVLAAVVMISITASLGGSMVYNHGVGIAHVTRLPASQIP